MWCFNRQNSIEHQHKRTSKTNNNPCNAPPNTNHNTQQQSPNNNKKKVLALRSACLLTIVGVKHQTVKFIQVAFFVPKFQFQVVFADFESWKQKIMNPS